ncbi:MAG TPA: hypothetical protein ENG73_00985 [Desulfobacterales bacterium]|nr:hypothetical protein [Desulfobacterales bacterium]
MNIFDLTWKKMVYVGIIEIWVSSEVEKYTGSWDKKDKNDIRLKALGFRERGTEALSLMPWSLTRNSDMTR